ncbi:MAG: hypothetical protein ACYSUY_12670 [Planctomycetota bacterium]
MSSSPGIAGRCGIGLSSGGLCVEYNTSPTMSAIRPLATVAIGARDDRPCVVCCGKRLPRSTCTPCFWRISTTFLALIRFGIAIMSCESPYETSMMVNRCPTALAGIKTHLEI